MNFMEKLERLEVHEDDINDYIDVWHDDKETDLDLNEYLGMTWPEYKSWVELTKSPNEILMDRKYGNE